MRGLISIYLVLELEWSKLGFFCLKMVGIWPLCALEVVAWIMVYDRFITCNFFLSSMQQLIISTPEENFHQQRLVVTKRNPWESTIRLTESKRPCVCIIFEHSKQVFNRYHEWHIDILYCVYSGNFVFNWCSYISSTSGIYLLCRLYLHVRIYIKTRSHITAYQMIKIYHLRMLTSF